MVSHLPEDRSKGNHVWTVGPSPFFPILPTSLSQPSAYGLVLPTYKVDLSEPLPKTECVLLISQEDLKPIKLTIKADCHTSNSTHGGQLVKLAMFRKEDGLGLSNSDISSVSKSLNLAPRLWLFGIVLSAHSYVNKSGQ